MSNELVRTETGGVPAQRQKALAALDEAYSSLGVLNDPAMSTAQRTLVTALAVTDVRKALSHPGVLPILRGLAGSPLGFRTDKDQYSDQALVEATTEAILRGLPVVGNCFNIIADRCYVTKEGFEYLVPQRAKYSVRFEVAKISQDLRDNGGHVRVRAIGQFRRHDAPEDAKNEHMEMEYSVRLNRRNKVAEENIEGKAKRKWLRDVWACLSGVKLQDGELEEERLGKRSPALAPSDFAEHSDTTLGPDAAKVIESKLSEAGLLDAFAEKHGPPSEWTEKTRTAAKAALEGEKRSMATKRTEVESEQD